MHVRGLYKVLGGQPPVPTGTDTRVLHVELYPWQFTRYSLPYIPSLLILGVKG
jgi:hypothetical protein